MRETFTSGSTRGEWAAFIGSPSLLLYRPLVQKSRRGGQNAPTSALPRFSFRFPYRGAGLPHSAAPRF